MEYVHGTGEGFSLAKFIHGCVWVGLAIIVGLGSIVTQVEDLSEVEWTWTVVGLLAYTVGRNALRFLKKKGKLDEWLPKPLSIVVTSFLCATLMVSLTGCVSTPWYGNPLKSQGYLKIKESPKGDFLLEINDNGDGTFAKAFTYNGEGPEPWRMTLGVETAIESPALIASMESLNNAVLAIPELAGLVGPMPDTPEARQGWLQLLFGFVSNNPDLLARLIGLLRG